MSEVAINIFWIICGAGFIYYPGILLSAMITITAREDKPRKRLKFGVRRFLKPKLIFAITYPLTYILALKMSKDAFDDHLIIEAYLWMVPALVFTTAFLIRVNRRRRA